jgi:hypothetical protein
MGRGQVAILRERMPSCAPAPRTCLGDTGPSLRVGSAAVLTNTVPLRQPASQSRSVCAMLTTRNRSRRV